MVGNTLEMKCLEMNCSGLLTLCLPTLCFCPPLVTALAN